MTTTFDESLHPRQSTGKFAEKPQSGAEVQLAPGAGGRFDASTLYQAASGSRSAKVYQELGEQIATRLGPGWAVRYTDFLPMNGDATMFLSHEKDDGTEDVFIPYSVGRVDTRRTLSPAVAHSVAKNAAHLCRQEATNAEVGRWIQKGHASPARLRELADQIDVSGRYDDDI